eukprot:TRINITY_DN1403_c0_g1_i1.p1 TRINITY_DN1403_c0_g1~~TRINITY_DN1403_c0_g1_i1.p1  ORF type:complete len:117 (-),score=10.26 TRINITY_DN1403_c0_g1_i1:59-409(-)
MNRIVLFLLKLLTMSITVPLAIFYSICNILYFMIHPSKPVFTPRVKYTILFTGTRSPFTLELLRIFNAAGHRIVSAESQPIHLSQHSNAVHLFFIPIPTTLIDLIDLPIPSFSPPT